MLRNLLHFARASLAKFALHTGELNLCLIGQGRDIACIGRLLHLACGADCRAHDARFVGGSRDVADKCADSLVYGLRRGKALKTLRFLDNQRNIVVGDRSAWKPGGPCRGPHCGSSETSRSNCNRGCGGRVECRLADGHGNGRDLLRGSVARLPRNAW